VETGIEASVEPGLGG